MASNEGIRVEPATPDDAAQVLRFIKGLAEYENLSEEVVATEDDIRRSFFGPDPDAEAVFAYLGTEPVGLAVFCKRFSSFSCRVSLYLEDIFVLPEWRGHGVGRELMAYASRLAQERGYSRLEWEVLDWNEPAIKFYREMGADRVNGWSTYRLTGDKLRRLSPLD